MNEKESPASAKNTIFEIGGVVLDAIYFRSANTARSVKTVTSIIHCSSIPDEFQSLKNVQKNLKITFPNGRVTECRCVVVRIYGNDIKIRVKIAGFLLP